MMKVEIVESRATRNERFVLAVVVLQPKPVVAGLGQLRVRRVRPLRLNHPARSTTQPARVVDDERQLVGGLSPVGRAEDRTELGGGEETLEHAERVLPEPQDAIALTDAGVVLSALASWFTRSSNSGQVSRRSPSTTAARCG